jgi:hypothetical protein
VLYYLIRWPPAVRLDSLQKVERPSSRPLSRKQRDEVIL